MNSLLRTKRSELQFTVAREEQEGRRKAKAASRQAEQHALLPERLRPAASHSEDTHLGIKIWARSHEVLGRVVGVEHANLPVK